MKAFPPQPSFLPLLSSIGQHQWVAGSRTPRGLVRPLLGLSCSLRLPSPASKASSPVAPSFTLISPSNPAVVSVSQRIRTYTPSFQGLAGDCCSPSLQVRATAELGVLVLKGLCSWGRARTLWGCQSCLRSTWWLCTQDERSR